MGWPATRVGNYYPGLRGLSFVTYLDDCNKCNRVCSGTCHVEHVEGVMVSTLFMSASDTTLRGTSQYNTI